LVDPWWVENWAAALAKIPDSDFLTGKTKPGNGYSKPFEATLDWFLKPDSVAKILDGDFDDAPGELPIHNSWNDIQGVNESEEDWKKRLDKQNQI
jgi:hypothetical protein